MTNSQPHLKPTPRQLRYLKDLAIRTGGSFTYPQTFAEADAQIKRLRKRRRTSAADRRREARQVSRDLAEGHGDAASIQPSEVSGYGSSATWRRAG